VTESRLQVRYRLGRDETPGRSGALDVHAHRMKATHRERGLAYSASIQGAGVRARHERQ
jgi:hypothetical protein